MAIGLGVAQALAFGTLAFGLPGGPGGWQWYDRLGVIVVSAAVAWVLSRFAGVSALPREDGLTVRNLIVRRDLAWAEVVAVRFGGGGPWVMLDLDDGETLPVMAVQRADGPRAVQESRRLATLVALHSRTDRDT
jgi:hypothetical protein